MSLTRVDLTAIQEEANIRILKSIAKNGLRSLKDIPAEDALTNPVLQSRGLDGLICVNSANLRNATDVERQTMFNTLVYEEYTGIYGIAAERQSPFQNLKHPELFRAELSARLLNSMVFILSAPWGTELTLTTKEVKSIQVPTKLRRYTFNDGVSQSRGKVLINKIVPFTNRVNEIRTTIQFEKFEMLAILVPAHLTALTRQFFGDNIDIISVPTGKVCLTSIPEILKLLHKETITSPVSIDAPLYKEALEEYSKNERIKEYSIHTVRLQTPFDFMVRTVENCQQPATQKLLKDTQAVIVNSERSLIVVHKRYGLARLERFKQYCIFPAETLEKVVKAHEQTEKYAAALKAATNKKMLNVYKPLSMNQIHYLARIGNAQVIEFYKDCFAISYEEKYQKVIADAIMNFDKIQNAAAICIQRFFNGYKTRKIVGEYRQAKNAFIQAEKKLDRHITRRK